MEKQHQNAVIEVEIANAKSFERALKQFKKRVDRVGVLQQYRERQRFIKPSEERRHEIKKARYKQRMQEQ